MGVTIRGYFDTRTEAEVVVERLVQEHGLDRNRVTALAEGEENTAGTEVSGADAVHAAEGDAPGGARAGRIVVTAEVPEAMADKATGVFEAAGAAEVRRGAPA